MKEFPKALYRDEQTFITVDNGKEEDAARIEGYMDYADLPEREAGVEGGSGANDINLNSFVSMEEYNALKAENERLIQENKDLHAKVSGYGENQGGIDKTQALTGVSGADNGKTPTVTTSVESAVSASKNTPAPAKK